MVNDVSRAFFCAPAKRQVFVELPAEDKNSEDMVGELNFSMYGTRDAAQNWGEECAETMIKAGFQRGKASPCTFYNEEKEMRAVIHGDDFTLLGMIEDLRWFEKIIEEKFGKEWIKTKGILGPEEGDDKSIRLLNRVIEWNDSGIRYEPDQRHAELMVR